MHSNDIDHSFPRTRTFGNEKVNWILDYMEFKLEIKLKNDKWNRLFAFHLSRDPGMGKVKEMIDYVAQPSCWWKDKIKIVSTLYKHREKIIKQAKIL